MWSFSLPVPWGKGYTESATRGGWASQSGFSFSHQHHRQHTFIPAWGPSIQYLKEESACIKPDWGDMAPQLSFLKDSSTQLKHSISSPVKWENPLLHPLLHQWTVQGTQNNHLGHSCPWRRKGELLVLQKQQSYVCGWGVGRWTEAWRWGVGRGQLWGLFLGCFKITTSISIYLLYNIFTYNKYITSNNKIITNRYFI